MLLLAGFILKGPLQAALVIAAMAVLGLLLPPVSWLSAAAVVLVTLVNGYRQGLYTTAIAFVGATLFAILIFSNMAGAGEFSPAVALEIVLYFVLLIWLPAWLVATVLKKTVSLSFTLQVLTVASLLAVVMFYLWYPDIGELWRGQLDQMVAQLSGEVASQVDDETLSALQVIENGVIRLLPGLLVVSVMLGTLTSLLLGRWWQAVYFNPGGFAREFQSLSLGKISALLALAITVLSLLQGSFLVYSLLMVVLITYYIQGTAILHAVFRIRQWHTAWLVLVYGLIMFLPQVMLLLIFAGLADSWLDIRQRLAKSAG